MIADREATIIAERAQRIAAERQAESDRQARIAAEREARELRRRLDLLEGDEE